LSILTRCFAKVFDTCVYFFSDFLQLKCNNFLSDNQICEKICQNMYSNMGNFLRLISTASVEF